MVARSTRLLTCITRLLLVVFVCLIVIPGYPLVFLSTQSARSTISRSLTNLNNPQTLKQIKLAST